MKKTVLAESRASALFDRDGWWDERCRAFASLRSVNETRLQILRRWMRDWFPREAPRTAVDFGCGGGFMSVPLAVHGTRVIGLDLARTALLDARSHSSASACFVCADMSQPAVADGAFDLALLCDVLEHVEDPAAVVGAAARSLRPGGALFVNTINRTAIASVLAVSVAEGIGLVPRGTHDARMFVRPSELESAAREHGLVATHRCGERPRLIASLLQRRVRLVESRSMAVSYCMGFVKEAR